MDIGTAQIRLICDDEVSAKAAIISITNAIGTARIHFTAPRMGRDKAGTGEPPFLVYGTYTYALGELGEVRGAATGATEQLRAPARPSGAPNTAVIRWTQASVNRWLRANGGIWYAHERNGKKGIAQGRTKAEHDLSWQALGDSWGAVARALGAAK